MKSIIGFIILFAVLIFYAGPSSIMMFVDLSTLILIIVGSIAISIITNDIKNFSKVKRVLKQKHKDQNEVIEVKSLLSVLSNSALSLGLVGMVINMILLFANLVDTSSIGMGLAVSLLSPLYGLVISELFLNSLIAKLNHTSVDSKSENNFTANRTNTYKVISVIFIVLVVVMIYIMSTL